MPERLVVDANVIISSLVNKGVTFSAFSLNVLQRRFEFIAPEFLLEEVKRHRSRILGVTKLSGREFEEVYRLFVGELTFIPLEEFIVFLPKAKKIAPHDKDVPYIALALALNCPLLSGDKGLKGLPGVKTISSRDLLDLLQNKK